MASLEGEGTRTDGLKFLGIARVDLLNLDFDHAGFSSHRPVSDRNVARLVQIFHIEGCKRLETDHHCIDGLVDVDHLREGEIESLAKRLPADLCTIPHIKVNIRCLHGLHRKLAAEQFLDENDRWWPVRIYSELDQRAHTATLESYANELCYNDGEIFRNIRQYSNAGDKSTENKWWARLTVTKRKDLRQLLKDERYTTAFDDLLPWPGLWHAIKLGSLHRLLTMKCDEEIICYLQHIATTWRRIVGEASYIVNVHTVQAIEGLAPAMSRRDGASVRRAMELQRTFPDVADSVKRQQLENNILAIPTLIPSLYTFFECLKYLEPCAKIMRGLLPLRPKRSIRQSLWGSYFEPPDPQVQHAESEMRPRPTSSLVQDNRSAAYIQLWLFTLRHFPDLTNTTPRKDSDKVKPSATEPNPIIWQKFGDLACSLGFCTAAAQRLRDSDAVRQLAISVSKQCAYDGNGDQLITSLTELITLSPGPGRSSRPILVGSAEVLPERRFGRPFQADHLADKPSLFLPHLYNHAADIDYDVTTFFCKRDMLVHFLNIKDVSLHNQFSSIAQSPTTGQKEIPCAPEHSACSNCAMLQDQIADDRRKFSALEAKLVECRSTNQHLRSQVTSVEERLTSERKLAAEAERRVREELRSLHVVQISLLERERNEAQNQLAAAEEQLGESQEQLAAVLREKSIGEQEISRLEQELREKTSDNSRLDDEKYDAIMNRQNDAEQYAMQIRELQGAHQTELTRICDNWKVEKNTQTKRSKQLKLRMFFSNGTEQIFKDLWFDGSQVEEVVTRNKILDPDMLRHYEYWLSSTEAHLGKMLTKQDMEAFVADPMRLASVWRGQKVLLLLRIEDRSAAQALFQSTKKQTLVRKDRPNIISTLKPETERREKRSRVVKLARIRGIEAYTATDPRPDASSVHSTQNTTESSTASSETTTGALVPYSKPGAISIAQTPEVMEVDSDEEL